MENGELCVKAALIALQLQLSVKSLAWNFSISIFQSLDHLVEEFGWIMLSVMEMSSPYLTVHTMDGVTSQVVIMIMILESVAQVGKILKCLGSIGITENTASCVCSNGMHLGNYNYVAIHSGVTKPRPTWTWAWAWASILKCF